MKENPSISNINPGFKYSRVIVYSGIIYFIYYIWLCIHFFIQRCSFIDAPSMIINVVNNGGFFIPLHRYTLAITECLPILAIKCGAGFTTIAQLYSLSYPLLFVSLFLASIFWLKNYWIAFLIVLCTCLGVKYTFYYLPVEGILGVTIAVIAVGWSWKNESKPLLKDYFIAAVFSFFIVFASPVNSFILIFSLGLLMFEKRKLQFGRPALLLLLAVLMLVLKNWLLPISPYETEITNSVKQNIGHFFHLKSHAIFVKWMIKDYFWLPITFVSVIILYVVKKEYFQLLWFVAFVSGFIASVNCRDYDGNLQFYIEHYFLTLSFLLVLPLIRMLTLNKMEPPAVKVFLLISLVAIAERGHTMYAIHTHFDERNKWQMNLTDKAVKSKSKRLDVCNRDIEGKPELITDKLPYEIWFLAKINYNTDATVSVTWDWNNAEKNDSLAVAGTEINIEQLNKSYFHFPKTAPEFYCK